MDLWRCRRRKKKKERRSLRERGKEPIGSGGGERAGGFPPFLFEEGGEGNSFPECEELT